MTGHVVTDAAQIVEVLHSDAVAPPNRSAAGVTLWLRNEMARFAPPNTHADRRSAVVEAIDRLDVDAVCVIATAVTRSQLNGTTLDVVELARSVPVASLALAMGLVQPSDHIGIARLLGAVDAIAGVIGRGLPPSAGSDEATSGLLALADGHPLGSVPVLSMLYQSLDATAALITTTLHAMTTRSDRVAAVPRTTRIALADLSVADVVIDAGTDLTLEIGPAGLEFGAGPHACPGRAVAERIASAVIESVAEAGFVTLDEVTLDDDRRPTRLVLRRVH